ncbi:MAG: peptide chain release factor subunit 1 [Gaiellaceae bacterium]|nr:peptide chain release factor subunit 1 [Gaiellaceae bacterium]
MAGVDLELVRELAVFRAQRGQALSLYLDLDPSTTPTAAGLDARVASLLHEGRGLADSVPEHAGRVGLVEDLGRVARFFDLDFERDGALGVAVFSDGPDDLWRVIELPETVRDEVWIGDELHVAPLAPLTAPYREALVAVVGREQGLLLELVAGRLVPIAERFDEQPGRHDQGGWSQANYQRHIENLVLEHLRDVAGQVDEELRARPRRPALILVGTDETTASFAERLSVEARAAVVGTAHAEAHATPSQLLALVTPLVEQAEARAERTVLDGWRESAGRHGRATTGWEETLAAASDGKVATLLFREGAARPARRCPECGRVEAVVARCPLDDAAMERLPDGLDGAIRQTLRFGGELVPIRHHQDLDPVGGIGALLRF